MKKMNEMKKLVLMTVILTLGSTACSSAPMQRTKWTDPAHRVFIDPNSLDSDSYVRLETSLVESNKFFVVDRARAFEAVKAEQDLIHREDVDRFDDEEKYAIYGKMYSVGAVITANERCQVIEHLFSHEVRCEQHIGAIDTTTGQMIHAVSHIASASIGEMPAWDDTVDKFNKSFPKTWDEQKYDSKMTHFRKVAAESALRQKEKLAREKSNERF
jgi:hypothetical protein